MNLCEALVIVRNCSVASAQMKTKRWQAALKIIDRKIQGLLRSKAWRQSYQAMPFHAGDDNFKYPIPEADHQDMVIAPGVTALIAPNASPDTVAALQEMARLSARETEKFVNNIAEAQKHAHEVPLKLD